ncbi:MAG TPA: SRPBCC domain-containing protein [Ktedonobacteraceae bacterium]|nr:SRPBCC domain-containing protein [Ktedonobacteraceae bacterium]
MDKIIHQTVRLHCGAQRAFEMFTVNECLQSWLATLAEVEPEGGGKYELFWNPNEREQASTLGCKVTAIEPEQLLAFEWKGPPQFSHVMNTADPLTHVVVCFVPSDELFTASTDIHLIHSGWHSTWEWELARQWHIRAWEEAFVQLRGLVNR